MNVNKQKKSAQLLHYAEIDLVDLCEDLNYIPNMIICQNILLLFTNKIANIFSCITTWR